MNYQFDELMNYYLIQMIDSTNELMTIGLKSSIGLAKQDVVVNYFLLRADGIREFRDHFFAAYCIVVHNGQRDLFSGGPTGSLLLCHSPLL